MAFQEASSSSTSSSSYFTASSSYFTASSSSFTGQWAYDVFLSFRGRDTRNNFIAHLYEALIRMGINTYKDKDLERGKNILPALLTAIEDSKIAVIVFSQNYASSSWCLDELSKIVECKEKKEQIVLPVFYKIDPSEVRQQKKSFEEAFTKHEERFKDDQKKVQKWKTNLTQVANLSGWHLGDENEAEFIRKIIDCVKSKLVQNPYFQVAKHPIGIELPEHTEQRDRTKLQSSAGDKPKMHECSIHCLEIAKGQALGGHMRRHRATINQGLSPITLIDSKVPAVLKRVMRLDDLNLKPSENNLKLLFGRKAMS